VAVGYYLGDGVVVDVDGYNVVEESLVFDRGHKNSDKDAGSPTTGSTRLLMLLWFDIPWSSQPSI
jgi:hypothetical protein